MLPLMRLLEQGGKFLQCIKHGARYQGLPAGPVRRPLRELGKDDARALETTIRTLQTSVRQIERGVESTDRGTEHVRIADA